LSHLGKGLVEVEVGVGVEGEGNLEVRGAWLARGVVGEVGGRMEVRF
jgi:hypothetical protein